MSNKQDEEIPDDLELDDNERFRLQAFMVRQFGFEMDEIKISFPTDADLVRGVVITRRMTENFDVVDTNDEDMFPEDDFGVIPDDNYKLTSHEELERKFYAEQDTAREERRKEILKKIAEAKEEAAKMKAEAEKKLEEERKNAKVEFDENVIAEQENDIPEQEKIDEKTSPVTREEMRAALKALMEE